MAMMPAVTDSERIKFHTLDRETGERVESRYLDAVTGAPVEPDDQVRGFETSPNEFVIVQDEDLEAVGLD
ncbi:Ku protein, partial [Stenotrophomonas maltophilia]|uniref:Ku protein n=1 Tax=Stenotrophomonas maltophilia TaxID=40324 RepID=UPI0031B696A4